MASGSDAGKAEASAGWSFNQNDDTTYTVLALNLTATNDASNVLPTVTFLDSSDQLVVESSSLDSATSLGKVGNFSQSGTMTVSIEEQTALVLSLQA